MEVFWLCQAWKRAVLSHRIIPIKYEWLVKHSLVVSVKGYVKPKVMWARWEMIPPLDKIMKPKMSGLEVQSAWFWEVSAYCQCDGIWNCLGSSFQAQLHGLLWPLGKLARDDFDQVYWLILAVICTISWAGDSAFITLLRRWPEASSSYCLDFPAIWICPDLWVGINPFPLRCFCNRIYYINRKRNK